MNSTLNNFQTYFDDCYPVIGNFDHHVASPGLSYSSNSSAPKCTQQYQQHSKRPGLLRLDSVGEISSSLIPTNGQIYSKGNSKPVLRNSKSVDSDFASRANRFLAKSKMASSVKSLTRNPSSFHNGQCMSTPMFTKTCSFSQLDNSGHSHRFCDLKTLSSSFNFSHQSSVLEKMFLTPSVHHNNNVYGSTSHQEFPSVSATMQTAVGTYMDSVLDRKGVPAVAFTSSPSIYSSIAASYAAFMQPSSSNSLPDQAMQFLESKDKDIVPFIAKSSELPITDVKTCDSIINVELEKSSSASTADTVASDLSLFDEKDTEGESISSMEAPLKDEFRLNLSLDDCIQDEKDPGNCDALKSDNDIKSIFEDISHSSLKLAIDPSSILSAPRKTVKKGRPTSKKQKKRQREKRKHEPCSSEDGTSYSWIKADLEEEPHVSGCATFAFNDSDELNSSVKSLETSNSELQNSLQRESSPVKAQSKLCPIASFFFGQVSDLEDTDDNDSDDCEGNSEWSVSEDERVYISPMKCPGFNVALNLDLIFKRKSIPSLKSVLAAEDSESDSEASSSTSGAHSQSLILCSSEDNSVEDTSVEFCVPLVTSELGLSTGLSIDSLFTGQARLKRPESTFDVVDGLSPGDHSHHISNSSLESYCLEAISQINARWEDNYPTAGFRSCQSCSSDEIKDSSIKVRFATGSNLLTVHIVGTEERGGTWHHYALDRERFQRRILDLEKIVSPILEASHRAKILEWSQCQE